MVVRALGPSLASYGVSASAKRSRADNLRFEWHLPSPPTTTGKTIPTQFSSRRMDSRRRMRRNRHSCFTCLQEDIPPSCAELMTVLVLAWPKSIPSINSWLLLDANGSPLMSYGHSSRRNSHLKNVL